MKRTDLALEAHQQIHPGSGAMDGVELHQTQDGPVAITQVRVITQDAARQLGKPIGNYITLELAELFRQAEDIPQQAGAALARQLEKLLPRTLEPVLVVGLGNAAVTPDAVGPRSLDHLLVTRHLRQHLPDLFGSLSDCCAFAPGVLGSTGIESAEMVKGVLQVSGAAVMIVIDALAACEEKRLCCTVQLADTGIVPGSGIGNHRAAFNRDSMGVPVIAIGVPTVIAADVLRGDAAQGCSDLIVTPSDIDARVARMARIIAAGINRALFWQLSEGEIAKLIAP